VQKTCPHANLPDLPNVHHHPPLLAATREQRQQLLLIVSAAEARGQARVVEMNRQVLGNLEQIMTTLEAEPEEPEAIADAS
jgi:hypothetical protein